MSIPKIVAIDAGYASIGVAVMEYKEATSYGEIGLEWCPVELACITTDKSNKKIGLRQSDDIARRIAQATRELKEIVDRNQIGHAMVELPPAGSGNPNVARTLAFAAAMIATFVECQRLTVEWYTPDDTRRAAGVPKGMKDKDNVKKIVMAAMGKKYPLLNERFGHNADLRNHVADALATFEAGRHGNLVRLLTPRPV